MMASVHVTVGITTATLLEKSKKKRLFAVSFISNIVLHGILDLLPHSHPINSYLDIAIALLLFSLIFFTDKKHRKLFAFCYAGSILPDIIDLGIFRVLPVGNFKIFPWHFKAVFDLLDRTYTSDLVNMTANVIVILTCVTIFLINKVFKSKLITEN
jgi:hypothetical protein